MRVRRSVRVDSAAKDAAASPASSDTQGSGVASSPPAERTRLSLRRLAREDSPEAMEWERNNTVRLIELIRARPCLWDASSRRYTERHCRRDALADVARTLGVSLLCVQKKWTNLRTQYFRERTRLQTIPGHSPRWFGFNMMRFLEDGPIGQHQRSSSAGSSGMVVELVDDDSHADSCWATSSADCGRDPDDVEIVIEQAPLIKQQVKDPFDEEDQDEDSCQPPTPTPQVELTMPPATPPPAPRQPTPPPTPAPQKKLRHAPRAQAQAQAPPQAPATSGAGNRQPAQANAEPQPRGSQAQPQQPPPREAEPPRPHPGRTVQAPTAAEEAQRDYSPPPSAAVRGTKRRVEVVDPMTIPSTSTAAPAFPLVTEPPEEVHATLHDRLDMYGMHVASRLRQIQDPYLRMVAINRIDNALFEAGSAEMMGQHPSAPAASAHSTAPPTAPTTAANAHFPPANARPSFHMMGTYHQTPAMQPDHPGTAWQNGPVVEEVDSKANIFMGLS